jgi:hypothetical protein
MHIHKDLHIDKKNYLLLLHLSYIMDYFYQLVKNKNLILIKFNHQIKTNNVELINKILLVEDVLL